MNNFAHVSAATDISRFSAMRADARRDADASFAKVAEEFEALFIQMMLKAARDASPEGGLFDSSEMKLYQEMMDSQVALEMAEHGGLGFASLLQQQLLGGETDDLPRELMLPPRRTIVAQPIPVAAPQPELRPAARADAATAAPPRAEPTVTEFIRAVGPLAGRAAEKLGLEPDVIVAQAALETGWGKHTIEKADGTNSHNYFGIKAGPDWDGEVARVRTHEFINGRVLKVTADFRAYPDPAAAFDDYVNFLNAHPRYSRTLPHDGDPRRFAAGLAAAGYATDPQYADKILALRDQIIARSMYAER
jgi:flagellar protein FlgJ